MHTEILQFAARLCFDGRRPLPDPELNRLALDLFALQFKYNSAYRTICEARKATPDRVEHWTQIPAVPAAAFKELDLSCVPPEERTAVFHSSGTTEQIPSRHFHCPESLNVYEAAVWSWFQMNVATAEEELDLVVLTPPPHVAQNSSLVHMFETVRCNLRAPESVFAGKLGPAGWEVDFTTAIASLQNDRRPKLVLGTAFSFVHLLDHLMERNLRFSLPPGSRVMETGGYKNRSRTMPRTQLHSLIATRLGVPGHRIICEYGMSELSSQAYAANPGCVFRFPSWTQVQVLSPETGREVTGGETGLIRVFDLANVFSVAAIQTEDLAVRTGDGFELIGRAAFAEPKGCSLMTV